MKDPNFFVLFVTWPECQLASRFLGLPFGHSLFFVFGPCFRSSASKQNSYETSEIETTSQLRVRTRSRSISTHDVRRHARSPVGHPFASSTRRPREGQLRSTPPPSCARLERRFRVPPYPPKRTG